MLETSITPYLAPLSVPLIEFLDQRYHTPLLTTHLTLQDYLEHAREQFQTKWSSLAQRVIEKQPQLYEVMKPGFQRGEATSGRWFLETLTRLTPKRTDDKLYSRQTLARWREAGLVRYHQQQSQLLDAHTVAAMLALRLLDETNEYGWHPNSIPVSSWQCWRQDSPTSPIIPCTANPLPRMPNKAFLFTPYLAASLAPEWLPFGDQLAVRWYGTKTMEDGTIIWDLSDEDLQEWDRENEIIRSRRKIPEKIAPLNRHAQATLILLDLASKQVEQFLPFDQSRRLS